MKTNIIYLILIISISNRILTTKDQDEAQIENLKKEKESFEQDKSIISTWLKFWQSEVPEDHSENTEDFSKIQINDENSKGEEIVHNLEVNANLNRNLIDFDYKFENCKKSLENFELHLSPILELENYYSLYYDENGNTKNILATNFGEEFNLKMYQTISQMNRNEDELKKGIITISSTSDYIKSPNFSMQDFFLNSKKNLKKVEIKLLKNDNVQLTHFFTQYITQRQKMITNTSTIQFLNNSINSEYKKLFEIINGMLGVYKQKKSELELMNKIENSSLRDINELFRLRVTILDQKNLINGSLDEIQKQRDEIDKILGKSEFIVNDLSEEKGVQKDNSNIEELMRKDQEKIDVFEKENDIVGKIRSGEMEMKDIESKELGQEVVQKIKDGEGKVVVQVEGVFRVFVGVVLILVV